MAEAEVVPLRKDERICNLDAEAALLSAMMNDAARYDEVIDIVQPHMCYSDANKYVFGAIVTLREAGKPLDVVTVAHALNAAGKLLQAGGTPYLAQLTGDQPYTAHVEEHASIVREKWRLRQALARAQTLVATIRGSVIADEAVQDLLEEAELTFGELAHQQRAKHLVPIKDSLDTVFRSLQEMASRGVAVTGTPMQFRTLDEATSGLHDGDLYVVAGRPGSGKTSFAMSVAENIAAQGEGAAIFSLEMPDSQLVTRMLSSHTRIPLGVFRMPNKMSAHWGAITTAMGAMETLPLWVDDSGSITVSEIRARVRKLKADIAAGRISGTVCKRLKLVVIDYMQLVSAARGHNQNREQEVSQVSRTLKQLAKDEDVAVMALSQLNRGVESRKGPDKRPQLSDLRESGAIEQDADTVMFVYRPEMYADDAEFAGIAEIIIGKQRNGPTGIHRLAFKKECVRFDSLARDEFDEYDGFQPDL